MCTLQSHVVLAVRLMHIDVYSAYSFVRFLLERIFMPCYLELFQNPQTNWVVKKSFVLRVKANIVSSSCNIVVKLDFITCIFFCLTQTQLIGKLVEKLFGRHM